MTCLVQARRATRPVSDGGAIRSDGEDENPVEEQFDEAGAGVAAVPGSEQVAGHPIPTLR
ncbi:MAG: hypothetical protein ACXW3K_03440 [Brevundimonas sp.]